MKEKYVPSSEEIKKAEDMMSESEKESSKERLAELKDKAEKFLEQAKATLEAIEKDRVEQNKIIKDALGPDVPDIVWKDEYQVRWLKEAMEKAIEILEEK